MVIFTGVDIEVIISAEIHHILFAATDLWIGTKISNDHLKVYLHLGSRESTE